VMKDNFSVAYNPTYHTLAIRFTDGRNPLDATVRIYSMTGSLMTNQPLKESSTVLQIDNYQAGIYAVSISINGKVETKKVIVQ
jgi:hypothetical protein